MSLRKTYNIASSSAASFWRGTSGSRVLSSSLHHNKPKENIVLYQKESCPWSRKVREAFSMLDLDANIKPCPIEGTKYRPELKQMGGKEQDPNTKASMYESKDIIDYVFDHYGPGKDQVPSSIQDTYTSTGLSRMSTLMRAMPWNGLIQYKGDTATSAATLIPSKITSEPHDVKPKMPEINKPIHLYSFENSPYCRIVREALDVLELPYTVHNVAQGSSKRKMFVSLSGKMQCEELYNLFHK
ncbi:Glutathione S-transferase, N-terminal domain protein [Planoprotostelium fungivorum]|uniref:Glutathione S-transferase, N-terminal domain protein n=1 Tax=Planoprotostelium fungivorum TaxID=1890364 RepID=A0A2P6NY45_9EUKA|nr:Glutathione S-transferase, N-terminal domain protein [Planoprotostelium fungivorum]